MTKAYTQTELTETQWWEEVDRIHLQVNGVPSQPVYRIIVEATIEAGSPEEAQLITGQLLVREPLTGVGSWAPATKLVKRIA